MREWPTLQRKRALTLFESWILNDSQDWSDATIEPAHRNLALHVRDAMRGIPFRQDWKFDAEVAIATSIILDGLPLSVASDPAFWDWLNVLVVPDQLCRRWNITSQTWKQRNAQAHIFAPRRNWMGSLWWMAHMSREPSEDWVSLTRRRMEALNVDDVIAVVERPGQHGYPIELNRAIIRAVVASRTRKPDPQLIRRVMLLNSLRLPTIAPELHQGGLDGYARALVIDAGGIQP